MVKVPNYHEAEKREDSVADFWLILGQLTEHFLMYKSGYGAKVLLSIFFECAFIT
jgi:hypothetical protein